MHTSPPLFARFKAAFCVLLSLLALAYCAWRLAGGGVLQTNVLTLVPPTERNPLAETAVERLAGAGGNRALFLVAHADARVAKTTARRFGRILQQSGAFATVRVELPLPDPQTLVRLYAPFRYGLLAEADRAALTGGTFDAAGRLRDKLYAPFRLGPTAPLPEDPLGLLDRWLESLPYRHLKLEMEDGLLLGHADGRTWVLVSADPGGSAYDPAVQRRVVDAVAEAERAIAAGGIELVRTGGVFYAAAARASAQRDADRIGILSLAGIALLMLWAFRSPRPLLLGLASVGIGLVCAAAAVLALQGELHLITLVFGASLIGEAVDYSIQYFAARLDAGPAWEPYAGRARVMPGLRVALATSLIGYAVLALAPFPALRQIALFALVGLATAFLAVAWLLPPLLTAPSRRDPDRAARLPRRLLAAWQDAVTPRRARLLILALLLAMLPGWLDLRARDDIRLLVDRPADLAAQEARFQAVTGFGMASQFLLVQGEDAESVLRREEALAPRMQALAARGALTDWQAVSRFVPSATRQTENRALLARGPFADRHALAALLSGEGMRDEAASAYAAGLDTGGTISPEEWLASPLSAPFRHLWLGRVAGGHASLVLPQGLTDVAALSGAVEGLPGVTVVDKPAGVSRLFRDYRLAGGGWLGGALVLIWLVLRLRYGGRTAGVVLTPTVLGMGAALAAVGYLGLPFTLFSLMGLMLVLGVGVNYAIFLREGGDRLAAALIGVFLSAVTTLLAFGLLAFSTMPALAQFGTMLLAGVSVAVLLSPLVLTYRQQS